MKRKMIIIVTLSLFIFSCSVKSLNNENKISNGLTNKIIDVSGLDKSYFNPNSLISVEELNMILNKNKVRVVGVIDDSLMDSYLPFSSLISLRDITTNYKDNKGHLVDKSKMERVLSNLGIYNCDTVILYDDNNGINSTRMYWSMKVYGHKNIKILNGGLNSWIKKGFETVKNPIVPVKSYYIAKDKNYNLIANLTEIRNTNNNQIIIDVRSEAEYKNSHIPKAKWIYWNSVLTEEGKFKPAIELSGIFRNKGVTKKNRTIIIYSKNGNKAAHTFFVLKELLGFKNVKIYDGSYIKYIK